MSTTRLPRGYAVPAVDRALLGECDVTCFQATGPGGQHRNRTRSAVRLRHRPTGLVVIGRRRRSQHRNKADALTRLRRRLVELATVPVKRVPTTPGTGARRRRLEQKRRRSATKKLRGHVSGDD